MQTFPRRERAIDAPATIAAASVLTGINVLIINLQPIIMTTLADSRGLTDATLGQINAISIGFGTVSLISAPLWLRAVNWRIVCWLGIAIASITLLAGAIVSSIWLFMVVFGLQSFAQGFPGAVSFAYLGNTQNPDRAYGASVMAQSLLPAIAAIPLSSWIVPAYGAVGLFVSLALLTGVGLIACRWLPAHSNEKTARQVSAADAPFTFESVLPPSIALLASVLITAGIIGFWIFIGRIGASMGVSHDLVGLAVSLSALATMLTATLVTWLGGRLSSLTFALTGVGMIIGGYILTLGHGGLAYTSGTMLYALGWGFAQPGYWAVLRKVDVTGRLFVAAPATVGIAGVGIGLLAGPAIEHGGFPDLIILCAGLVVASAIALLVALRIAGQHMQSAVVHPVARPEVL
jgi:hypothetical protein